MWPLLLEKAFAKFMGSYAAIEGGDPVKALTTLTGYESTYLSAPFNDDSFKNMQSYFDKGCLLVTGSKQGNTGNGNEQQRQNAQSGDKDTIVAGHAYSILNVKTPTLTTSTVRLLKLRNPW